MLTEYGISYHHLIANKADSDRVEQALGHGPLMVIAIAEDYFPRDGMGLNDRFPERILPETRPTPPQSSMMSAPYATPF